MMDEVRYSEFDKKMFKIELWGIGLARVLFGIMLLVIFWNILWAVPVAIRVISLLAIGWAYDWMFSAIVKMYITKVLARISPTWAETADICFNPIWKKIKLSK